MEHNPVKIALILNQVASPLGIAGLPFAHVVILFVRYLDKRVLDKWKFLTYRVHTALLENLNVTYLIQDL